MHPSSHVLPALGAPWFPLPVTHGGGCWCGAAQRTQCGRSPLTKAWGSLCSLGHLQGFWCLWLNGFGGGCPQAGLFLGAGSSWWCLPWLKEQRCVSNGIMHCCYHLAVGVSLMFHSCTEGEYQQERAITRVSPAMPWPGWTCFTLNRSIPINFSKRKQLLRDGAVPSPRLGSWWWHRGSSWIPEAAHVMQGKYPAGACLRRGKVLD